MRKIKLCCQFRLLKEGERKRERWGGDTEKSREDNIEAQRWTVRVRETERERERERETEREKRAERQTDQIETVTETEMKTKIETACYCHGSRNFAALLACSSYSYVYNSAFRLRFSI